LLSATEDEVRRLIAKAKAGRKNNLYSFRCRGFME